VFESDRLGQKKVGEGQPSAGTYKVIGPLADDRRLEMVRTAMAKKLALEKY